MENASKALIIAGAILLSILIIGLGMMIYNQAKDATDVSGTMDELKASQYNSSYLNYEGDKVSGSNVKTLLDNIRNHNNTSTTDTDDSLTIKVKVGGSDVTSDIISARKAIKSGATYTVVAKEFDKTTGYVTMIEITENTKSN